MRKPGERSAKKKGEKAYILQQNGYQEESKGKSTHSFKIFRLGGKH